MSVLKYNTYKFRNPCKICKLFGNIAISYKNNAYREIVLEQTEIIMRD